MPNNFLAELFASFVNGGTATEYKLGMALRQKHHLTQSEAVNVIAESWMDDMGCEFETLEDATEYLINCIA